MTGAGEVDRVRAHYDREAASYDRRIAFFERVLFGNGRSWACWQAGGKVLEIAIGTGRNLPFYPSEVELTGIELSSAMLAIAERRAQEIGRPADLRGGNAETLDFGDEQFDTVVCTLSLCTIPDDRAAVGEIKRVLHNGGRFLLLEHVRSPVRWVRAGQRVLDPLFRRFQADHILRNRSSTCARRTSRSSSSSAPGGGIVERVVARKT